jgi:hypothetical protein
MPHFSCVKSFLPVSGFTQAVADSVRIEGFRQVCWPLVKECFANQSVRLTALTFLELTDFKFQPEIALDFKLFLALYDFFNNAKLICDFFD